MSGKRLLDAAAMFKASRRVATKYLAYRRHQFDAYSKTSTLARAVKNQTDRITLTVRAASALAERFNGSGHEYSTQAKESSRPGQDAPVPSKASVEGAADTLEKKQGLEQDHFYEKSPKNTTTEPLHDDQLGVKQERAKRYPLPDGSIPPVEAEVGQAKRDKDVFSGIPRTERAKEPSYEHVKEPHISLEPSSSNSSSIIRPSAEAERPSTDEAKKLQRQAEKQIPSQAAEPPPTEATEPRVAMCSGVGARELGVGQQQDVFYSPSPKAGKVLSALPRVKLPKATADTQESDPHVHDEQINQDVFYSSAPVSREEAVPQGQALPEQEGPSDEMYSELFHSPKVAKMLKGQPQQGKSAKGLDLPGANDAQPKDMKSSKEKDQATFTLRTPDCVDQTAKNAATEPQDTSSEEDARNFAEELAQDARKGLSSAEVSPS